MRQILTVFTNEKEFEKRIEMEKDSHTESVRSFLNNFCSIEKNKQVEDALYKYKFIDSYKTSSKNKKSDEEIKKIKKILDDFFYYIKDATHEKEILYWDEKILKEFIPFLKGLLVSYFLLYKDNNAIRIINLTIINFIADLADMPNLSRQKLLKELSERLYISILIDENISNIKAISWTVKSEKI